MSVEVLKFPYFSQFWSLESNSQLASFTIAPVYVYLFFEVLGVPALLAFRIGGIAP